ncbi:hypothetical protein M0O54_00360 [Acinetobacter lactucae]|uniref:DUF2213 domain-containing protein n=1 Tax=Acinetobacter lactucae TaxID=1785128 RepID=A0AB35K1K9_9GAMM|nr:hypothetical protein [Acinetobacter lactucae]MDD9318588.1 hypothetical protein [Acinetobacter lactucae]
MNNLLTASEAFAALQKGKTVLCRYAGDGTLKADKSFITLDQMPATVFGLPHYEFCIQLETTVLAEITFTKPVEPHELEDGQVIYIVMPTHILRTIYSSDNGEICLSVANGFAQLDEENAKLQLQAIGKTFGNMITDIEVKIGSNNKPRQQRGKKTQPAKDESTIEIIEQTNVTTSEDSLVQSEDFPENIGTALDSAIIITEQPYVSSSEDFLTQSTNEPDTKPNVSAQFEILLDAIRICQSEKELDSTCANLEKEGFSPEQIKSIDEAKQNRLTELDAQEIDAVTSVPENYESLVKTIQDAHTPEEVNSVVRYTSKWTEEQRKPLLTEMHKRLSELNQTKQQDDGLSPLIVRLQHAPDLNTLEELECEIPSRHPDVHKTLWNMAKKRRSQLNAASNEPAYLLEDGL